MIRVLLTGTLYGDPVKRHGQGGKAFVTGKLKADDGSETTVWASFITFGEEAERISRLKDGAALSISGRATLKVFEGKRGHQVALDVVAEQVAALKGKPRPRRGSRPDKEPFADLPGCDDLGGQY